MDTLGKRRKRQANRWEIEIAWRKGHAGHQSNEVADVLDNRAGQRTLALGRGSKECSTPQKESGGTNENKDEERIGSDRRGPKAAVGQLPYRQAAKYT